MADRWLPSPVDCAVRSGPESEINVLSTDTSTRTNIPAIFSGTSHVFAPKPTGTEGGPIYCLHPCHNHYSSPCHVVYGPVTEEGRAPRAF